VAQSGVRSPCLTIVGEVVRLRQALDWFCAERADVR
jgi:siroheme synthase